MGFWINVADKGESVLLIIIAYEVIRMMMFSTCTYINAPTCNVSVIVFYHDDGDSDNNEISQLSTF